MTLDEIKRAFDRDRLLQLAEAEGLARRGVRIQCPARCSDHDARRATVGERDGAAVWHCKGCGAAGTVVDLIVATRSLVAVADAARVLEEWLGAAPIPPPTREAAAKNGAALWSRLAADDPRGRAYLDSRGLGDAVNAGLVRFSTGSSGDRWVDAKAAAGYRVAVPLRDSSDAIRTFQLRATIPADPSKLSLAGVRGTFVFGDTSSARAARRVVLCEGLADYLALSLAAARLPDPTVDPADHDLADDLEDPCPVLGAPGTDGVRHLPEFLGTVRGREIVLVPQNDEGHTAARTTSAQVFARLERALRNEGAILRRLVVPAEHKDVAEWHARIGSAALASALDAALQVATFPRRPPAAASGPTVTSDAGAAAQVVPLAAPPAEDWIISNSYASACYFLRDTEKRTRLFGPGPLEYNEQTLSPTLNRQPVSEVHVLAAIERAELEFRAGGTPIKFSQLTFEKAVLRVAAEHPYHPVRDYLTGLCWDGTPRLGLVASELLSLPNATDLQKRMLRCFFVSAVARGLSPGCKVDTVLVFTGKQGRYKSTWFKILCGDLGFSDTPLNLRDKDSYLSLRRLWIMEWAELDSALRSPHSNVKSFISSASDLIRAPYARTPEWYDRGTVIVGTTNEEEFLVDPTGNRRWLPIRITAPIDLARTEAWRDQLWAEAVAAYKAGERWYLTADQATALEEAQGDHEKVDAWEPVIEAWLAKYVPGPGVVSTDRPYTTIADVLGDALDIEKRDWSRPARDRVADVLRRLGWMPGRLEQREGYYLTKRRVWFGPLRPTTPDPTTPTPQQ